MELAAINSVFANEEVKEKLLYGKAKWLISTILPTANFFIPSSCHNISERPYDSLSDNEKLAITGLEDGLAEALKIKVELALSNKRIQYFFFKLDTLFNGDLMGWDISQIGLPVNGRLRLCVFPALFSVPDGDENEEGEGSRVGGHDGGMTEPNATELESLVLVAKGECYFR